MTDRLLPLGLESQANGLLTSAKFWNKKLIIFNSASFCGFTKQLREFQDIFKQGLAVPIAIPTNDFGNPVSAGVYLYQIHANSYTKTMKMILLK